MLRVLSVQNLLLLLSSSSCSCSTKDSVSLDFGTFLTWICQNVLLATRFVYKFSYLNYYLRIQFFFTKFEQNARTTRLLLLLVCRKRFISVFHLAVFFPHHLSLSFLPAHPHSPTICFGVSGFCYPKERNLFCPK